MALHPLPPRHDSARDGSLIPAWQAVERKQKQPAHEWWVVTQPDHAALAGDLAAHLDFPAIPALSADAIRAIAAHDAGWAQFDNKMGTVPPRVAEGRVSAGSAVPAPLSFLDIIPTYFLIAWDDSIEAAQHIGPLGGIMVSEHFSRLARGRLTSRTDAPEDVQRLKQFLSDESRRQARLRKQVQESASQIEALTDVLQFCDLVSLYLCCGADEPAEFPQHFAGSSVHVRCEGDAFLFMPPVFGRGAALGVSARRYPGETQSATLPFLLG